MKGFLELRSSRTNWSTEPDFLKQRFRKCSMHSALIFRDHNPWSVVFLPPDPEQIPSFLSMLFLFCLVSSCHLALLAVFLQLAHVYYGRYCPVSGTGQESL